MPFAALYMYRRRLIIRFVAGSLLLQSVSAPTITKKPRHLGEAFCCIELDLNYLTDLDMEYYFVLHGG